MLKERFQIKNVKSPWKKDKGANIDSPVYTYKKGDKPLGVIYGSVHSQVNMAMQDF